MAVAARAETSLLPGRVDDARRRLPCLAKSRSDQGFPALEA